MNTLPFYIPVVFILTTLLTLGIFYKAANNSRTTLFVLLAWVILQTVIGLSGFYTITDTNPPRFLLLVLPPFLTILVLFFTGSGRDYMDRLDAKALTLLHIVRIPVEMVLFWLFVNKKIPELMTFEGRNFDIISGITTPIIYYFGFVKKRLGRGVLLAWNFLCLGLLLNIVVNALLSAPLPFQQFAFDQPNIAVLYFPYNLLPSIIVPLVLLSHLAVFRQLIKDGMILQG